MIPITVKYQNQVGDNTVQPARNKSVNAVGTRLRRRLSKSFHRDSAERGFFWGRVPGLFAGTRGRLYCLDRTTGSILWTNELSGLGYNMITFSGSTIAAAAAEIDRRRTAAASAAAAGS